MKHNLFLGIVNAPYRVDLCNELYGWHDCDIYFLHERLEDSCFSGAYCDGIGVYEANRMETRNVAGRKVVRMSFLRRLLKEHQPEVVFVPELSLTALSVLFLRWRMRGRYKVVSVCDDNMDMLTGRDLTRSHAWARRVFPKWLDNLVLTNPETVAWYRNRFGKGVFFPIMADERRLRKEMEQAVPRSERWLDNLGLRHRKIVLYVGRLIPVKNLERLLAAFTSVDERAVLVFVGDGVEQDTLQREAAGSVRILFLGRLSGPDLMAWYNLADVLVLPSVQEAFGAVVNEALVGGCPVAVSARAGSAFLVKEGLNGTVFNPESVPEMTAALNRLLSGPVREGPVRLRDSLMPMEFLPTLEQMLSQL